jgi:hypothetical protein
MKPIDFLSVLDALCEIERFYLSRYCTNLESKYIKDLWHTAPYVDIYEA